MTRGGEEMRKSGEKRRKGRKREERRREVRRRKTARIGVRYLIGQITLTIKSGQTTR